MMQREDANFERLLETLSPRQLVMLRQVIDDLLRRERDRNDRIWREANR